MSAMITAVYKMIVFDNGKIELTRQPMDYMFEDLGAHVQITSSNVSERVRQIIEVITKVSHKIEYSNLLETLSRSMVGKQITVAYKMVADENGIAEQTVADKCGRQLGLNKSAFADLVFDYLTHEGEYTKTGLYQTIVNKASSATDDLRYIQESFKQLGKK